MAYLQADFLRILEDKINFSPGDALSLCQHFIVQAPGDQNVYVD